MSGWVPVSVPRDGARHWLAMLAPAGFVAVIGTSYGFVLPLGTIGHLVGAAAGLAWGCVVALAFRRVARIGGRGLVPRGVCALTIACLAAVLGAGWLYNRMFAAVLTEAQVSDEMLGAMMAPPVPYFIALNSALELLLLPAMLALAMSGGLRSTAMVLAAAFAFLAARVWTYAVFAVPRVDISAERLAAADIAWFERTLAGDYRILLIAIALTMLIAEIVAGDEPARIGNDKPGGETSEAVNQA